MWIEHDGKGAPDLPPETVVTVRLRGGDEFTDYYTHWNACWLHDDQPDSCDITHYRVVPE